MSAEAAYRAIELSFGAPETLAATATLSPEQRDALRQFWIGRASGELTTALSFEFMLADLQQLSAPSALTELAERAIADEHRHVDWCLRFAELWGEGRPARAELGGTRPLSFEGASEQDMRLLRTVFGCCFSETVAVHVLLASQAEIKLESVARLNRQHVAEEVGHSRLGWALLAWPGLSARDRGLVAEFVPVMTRLTRALWCGPERAADAALHELGYLSLPLVQKACAAAFETVILPGLERNQIRI
jgi:hypothetical protein